MSITPSHPPVQPPMSGPSAVHSLATPDDEPRKAKRHKPTIRVAALNITSMMDLVLNLLLFFVLSSSFALTEGSMPATLPTGGPGGQGTGVVEDVKPPDNPIIISLHKIGSDRTLMQIEGTNKALDNFEDLFKTLEEYHANGVYKLDNPITIKPDGTATWNQVVNAFNAVIRARYTSVGFAPAS